jgi:hypothetical protein
MPIGCKEVSQIKDQQENMPMNCDAKKTREYPEGFEVLTAVFMKSSAFWKIKPSSSEEEHVASFFRLEE